jgi:predicted DNA-binding transcriptional regulator YafY
MSPEFLRRYYVLRIVSTPQVYGIDYNGYVPLVELQRALDNKRNEFIDSEFHKKLTSHSQKTIKRDIQAIESYFDVEIKLKKNHGYYIEEFEQTRDLREIFDKTELFLLNHKSYEWQKHITTENSSLNNNIDINSLVNAIDEKLQVHIVYDGWFDDNKFQRYEGYVQPLHIKEANRAWYLIAHNTKIGIYSFSLDNRVKELKISSRKIEHPIDFDENDYYKNSIGILKDSTKPQHITLKVINHHFRYLLSKPMHHSQKVISYPILAETETIDYSNPDIWGTIEIFVLPSYELMMEILKFNVWVKVINPPSFIEYMKKHLKQIIGYYK